MASNKDRAEKTKELLKRLGGLPPDPVFKPLQRNAPIHVVDGKWQTPPRGLPQNYPEMVAQGNAAMEKFLALGESYFPLPITVTRKKLWKRSSTKFLVISDLTYLDLQTNNVFSTTLRMLRNLTLRLKQILHRN